MRRAPRRLLDVSPPKGSVPVVKDLAADKWVADSAAIVDMLEERFPRPAMGKADSGPDVCVPWRQPVTWSAVRRAVISSQRSGQAANVVVLA